MGNEVSTFISFDIFDYLFYLFLLFTCLIRSRPTLHDQLNYRFDERGQRNRALSIDCRQYRTRRIAINVRINGLAYVVEVLGGFVIGAFQFLPPANFLYIAAQTWYGSIIPSVYLMNCDDIKVFVMNHGWLTALSKIYAKKEKDKDYKTDYVNKRDVEDAPKRNGRPNHVPSNSEENKGNGKRMVKTDKSTPGPGMQNKNSSANQLNRRRTRQRHIELVNSPCSVKSDAQSIHFSHNSSPFLTNNFTPTKLQSRKLHKPLIKNSKTSIYSISNDQTLNRKHRPPDLENGKVATHIPQLLPNQPDYS